MEFKEVTSNNAEIRRFQKMSSGQGIMVRVQELGSMDNRKWKPTSVAVSVTPYDELSYIADLEYHADNEIKRIKVEKRRGPTRVVEYDYEGHLFKDSMYDADYNRYHKVNVYSNNYVSDAGNRIYEGPVISNDLLNQFRETVKEVEKLANDEKTKSL